MGSRNVWSSKWFSVESIDTKPEWGLGNEPYYTIKSPDSVLILPVTDDGRYIFVRQYRPAVGRYVLELPAGAVDESESADIAAKRELQEETGYSTSGLHLLARGHHNASRFSSTSSWFAALDLEAAPGWLPWRGP